MIKAVGQRADGSKILVLGFTPDNLARMLVGTEPVHVTRAHLDEMGLADQCEILVVAGKSLDAITEMLGVPPLPEPTVDKPVRYDRDSS